MQFFTSTPTINFFGKRTVCFALSGILCVVAVLLIVVQGFNYGIDFRGGTNIQVKFLQPKPVSDVRNNLKSVLGITPVVQVFGDAANNELLIQFAVQGAGNENEKLVKKATAQLKKNYPGVDIRQIETIGPKVGADLKENAIYAVLISFGVILLYIGIRFKYYYGLGAWLALIHDTLITLGIIILLGFEFDLTILAAILTVNGYSLNDTIVVFDRIRENTAKHSDSFGNIINLSINETLSRTIVTSITTLIAVIFLFIFGGEGTRGFAFTIILGILVGTYSSIFVASPILAFFYNRRQKGESKHPIGISQ